MAVGLEAGDPMSCKIWHYTSFQQSPESRRGRDWCCRVHDGRVFGLPRVFCVSAWLFWLLHSQKSSLRTWKRSNLATQTSSVSGSQHSFTGSESGAGPSDFGSSSGSPSRQSSIRTLLRTAQYTYVNKMDEDKSWMGATPSMSGRQLKKPKVKFFFQLLRESWGSKPGLAESRFC